MKTKVIITLLGFFSLCLSAFSQNASQARQIAMKTLDVIQAPDGIEMNYHVQFTRLFSKEGVLAMKGNKFHRESKRTEEWYDGVNHWSLNKASKKIKLNMPSEYGNDKDLGEYIQQVRTDYNFTLDNSQKHYVIYVKAKKDAKVDIKEAVAYINKTTYEPVQLKMKWSIFWLTLDVLSMKKVDYPDSYYRFDQSKHPDATIIIKK